MACWGPCLFLSPGTFKDHRQEPPRVGGIPGQAQGLLGDVTPLGPMVWGSRGGVLALFCLSTHLSLHTAASSNLHACTRNSQHT